MNLSKLPSDMSTISNRSTSMPHNTLTSVIIPVYNEERFLRQTLESVVNQVDCVIIGDNASTDGTAAICREFAEKYSHIDYFRNKNNLGGYENMRLCNHRVKTEYFFHLGGHDVVPDNYVSVLKNILEKHPSAVGAYADQHEWELDDSVTEKMSYYPERIPGIDGLSFTELFAHPSPLVRFAALWRVRYPDLFWHALFRKLPKDEKNIKILQEEHNLVWQGFLLYGELHYGKETCYYCRNVHPDDDRVAFRKRTHGDKFDGTDLRRKMREDQIAKNQAALEKFGDFHDPILSEAEKWDLFWRLYRAMQKKHGFAKLDLHFQQTSPLYGNRLRQEEWRNRMMNFLRFILTVDEKPGKLQFKFFGGPSFSIPSNRIA